MAINTSFSHRIAGATLAALVGLWGSSAVAASPVPATFTQQGRILDKAGAPVSSKLHFVFTLYDSLTASAAANVLWSEEQDITLDDGYFSWQLGTVKAIDPALFDGSTLYLGVTVGSDAEMAPREPLTSVPYALVAGSAAVASSVAFTSITGIPSACPDGQYLKGYTALGAKDCGALPTAAALSCDTVSGTAVTAGTSAFASCPSGTVLTGGGCNSTVALLGSYVVPPPPPCTTLPCFISLCLIGRACNGDWNCITGSAGNTTAYARCCKVM
ncbi:MAG: hypothetical protein ABI488_03285 [Polyangiaceae bacterium]